MSILIDERIFFGSSLDVFCTKVEKWLLYLYHVYIDVWLLNFDRDVISLRIWSTMI